jgi:hypothetical protein
VSKQCLASVATVLLVLTAAPLRAQSGDFAAGWSFLHSNDLEESLPIGFHLGLAARFNDWFAIASDFGWNQKGDEFEDLVSLDVTLLTYSAGPRLYFGSDRATGFAHALVGFAYASFSANAFGIDESRSTTEFLAQPGGGVDIRVTEDFGVRLQGDYQWIKNSDGNLRFVLAAFFRFGETERSN